MAEAQVHELSVFADPPHLGGTKACVVVADRPVLADDMLRFAQVRQLPATCFAIPRPDTDYDIHCYSSFGPIRCCGHGLLATAYTLHCLYDDKGDADAHALQLYQPEADEPLQVKREESGVLLRFPRLQTRSAQVPAWAADALGIAPLAAAIAGGEEDYLILELDADVALAELDVKHSVILQKTRRAIIVTQRGLAGASCKTYDFLLRYFAPQYGVDEDQVTGSANRVLADFWHQRLGQDHFRALQCSATGGVVETRVDDDYVWIGGRIEMV